MPCVLTACHGRVASQIAKIIDAAENPQYMQICIVVVGAACLLTFMQANYTGPVPKDVPASPMHQGKEDEVRRLGL